ncbi:efflux RND transporter periplasmic adaptor subunit [Candidatus Woesebacteria bacterium]|nr:efflux RND transporter periplasmic adaptor subunit [Candidatus Woesebacteria bacterium]
MSQHKLFTSLKKYSAVSSWKVKFVVLLLLVGAVFGAWKVFGTSNQTETTYQTEVAESGTLISSIAGSGTITSGNYTNVTTKTSGVVTKVYVTNGDTVTKGQKIAEVQLDDYARERQSTAWVAYLEAKEAYLAAVSGKSEADIAMWQARQDVVDAQEALDDLNDGGDNPATGEEYTDSERAIIPKTLEQKREAFTAVEAKYLNADADISKASAKVTAALRDYQENSSTIVAPADGEITDLALAEGIIVSASSATSQTSGATIVSAQTVGKVNDSDGQLIATVNLTEIDIINVKANQKVTITLDAYEDKTFTGKVMAVNTSGNISSGVTSYPVTVLLDPVSVDVYPNMAVSVEIITDIATDVITVPNSAIQTVGDQSVVQVMKDGEVVNTTVVLGISNDSETVITSGINVGDEIVTATITTNNNEQDDESSPFSGSSFGGGGGGRGGFSGGPPGGF